MTAVNLDARAGRLPAVLAGPILRRTEPGRAIVWVATRPDVLIGGRAVRLASGRAPLASGEARRVRLGPGVAVQLLALVPDRGTFPRDELLGYELEIRRAGGPPIALALDRLAYGGLGLPTFVVPSDDAPLKVMHGSCRLLHGAGQDAFLAADETLARPASTPSERAGALFLTGDQVYADDVAGAMIRHLRPLADVLLGSWDASSVPGIPSLAEVPVDGRKSLAAERACFTSPHAGNHLMSFGEFVAMYLCAWSDALWPASFPSSGGEVERALPSRLRALRARRRYDVQRERLEAARAALPAVRRVLANTPTYMNFDDHDVTDDWNLTRAWRDAVHDSPTGRRVVANALAAYWAFQGWGNDPDAYTADFKSTVTRWLQGAVPGDGADFDDALWSFDRWSFIAPLQPVTVVLDTRTQRSYDSRDGAARLLGADEIDRVARMVGDAGHARHTPLLMVSAVPVFGFELQERRQRYLVDRLGPYEIDFEAWHSNFAGMVDFMGLIDDLQPSFCVLLSGDVHYGVTAQATFSIQGRELLFTQLVSSGQKHAGAAASASLGMLGRLLRARHERVGWKRAPECRRSPKLADHFLRRAVNTDEWDAESPVFLAPLDARLVGVQTPEDFRDCRVYARPTPGTSMLIGENNVGLMSLREERVTHRLLIRHRGATRSRTATIDATTAV